MSEIANIANIASANDEDRSFDLSLRLLTALVIIALAGSVSLLFYRWLAPGSAPSASSRAPTADKAAARVAVDATVAPPRKEEVLMDPHQIFQCDEHTFTDKAVCGNGREPAPRARAAP